MEFDWDIIMLPLSIFLMVIYSTALVLILLYSLSQLNLLFNYLSFRSKNTKNESLFNLNDPQQVPFVTIQLPVFNELYVIERLLESVSKIDYPKDRLEIQVLDDSNDESIEITAKKIKELSEHGIDIVHVFRDTREGFKAGALKYGLTLAKGEYIAIFDADFLPSKDWLQKTVPHFKNPEIGVVQTRWGHINRDYSVLTRVQAFALDAHFTLEQVGRNSKEHFINFNGTAGIWRKECILDAGNWEGDTLTEDLDLSYRAQLKNWKFKYLEEVETPAELPVVISAIRSQQFRWNKGGAENFQKMIKRVFSSKHIPLKTRLHAGMHLLNSTMFLNVLIVALLSIPMLYIKNEWGHLIWYFNVTSLFIISTVIFFICYWFTYKRIHGGGLFKFIEFVKMFCTFYTIAMGFSLHNSLAVIEGHRGKRSDFVRTPKFNLREMVNTLKSNKYLKGKKPNKNMIFEAVLCLYFLFGMYSAFVVGNEGDFGLFPFHLILCLGFGFIFYSSVRRHI